MLGTGLCKPLLLRDNPNKNDCRRNVKTKTNFQHEVERGGVLEEVRLRREAGERPWRSYGRVEVLKNP